MRCRQQYTRRLSRQRSELNCQRRSPKKRKTHEALLGDLTIARKRMVRYFCGTLNVDNQPIDRRDGLIKFSSPLPEIARSAEA